MQHFFHASAINIRFSETLCFSQLFVSKIVFLAHSSGSDSSHQEEILLNPYPLVLQHQFLTMDFNR